VTSASPVSIGEAADVDPAWLRMSACQKFEGLPAIRLVADLQSPASSASLAGARLQRKLPSVL